MMKKLLHEIAFAGMFLMFGALCTVCALFSNDKLLFSLGGITASLCFLLAWLHYGIAKRTAETCDDPTEIEIIIERLMRDAPQPGSKETEEDHEDIGHPV